MMFLKGKTPRRREVRRTIDRPGSMWFHWLTRRDVAFSAVYVLAVTTVASLIVLAGRNRLPYHEGQIVTRPLYARIDFESIDKEATEDRRRNARDQQRSIYGPNQAYFDVIREKLAQLIALAAEAKYQTVEQIPEETRKSLQLDAASFAQLQRFVVDGRPTEFWRRFVSDFVNGIASIPVLDPADVERERAQSKARRIVIQHPTRREMLRWESDIFTVTVQSEALKSQINTLLFPVLPREELRHIVVSLVLEDIRKTYVYDEDETERRREAAADRVSEVKGIYKRNDLLVDAGVSEVRRFADLDIKLIQQERAAYRGDMLPMVRLARTGGLVGLVLFGAVGLWIYFWAYYPRIRNNPMRGFAILGLLLLCQAGALGLTGFGPEFFYVGAVFPTLFTAIVLAIAYDQRFALAVGAFHVLLVLVTLDLPLSFGLVLLLGVGCAVGQLRDVRTRSKLVQVGFWSGLVMAVGVGLVGFVDRPMHLVGEAGRILNDSMFALATGFVTGLFVQGILPGIERFFKVSTSMTLKELNDASHPLLRHLAERTAGTYQHSLRIADMSESAADAIGANGLLCRVGAMYHDIGKMNKPTYFVENQGGRPNRHEKLSPTMSVLIIVGHVKDGVEMAREYRLPHVIRHFIESHHGTTLVEYFYHAARKQKELETDGSPEPSEFEFRYPGPKPQTREAAIIMLCDGLEGAARTLGEPTPVRLEQLVHNLASKRLMDGQFDECNLTLQELHKIESSVTKTLCAIYHSRISYPDDAKRDETGDEDLAVNAAS